MKRRGFTLIELLLAVALSVILMGALLSMLAALSRDGKRIARRPDSLPAQRIARLVAWDAANARTLIQAPDGSAVAFVGHGALDRNTLKPTGRLVRVIYRCVRENGSTWLVREQQSLDDPARPAPWRELAAGGIDSISLSPASGAIPTPDLQTQADESIDLPTALRAGTVMRVPARLRLRMSGTMGTYDEMILSR